MREKGMVGWLGGERRWWWGREVGLWKKEDLVMLIYYARVRCAALNDMFPTPRIDTIPMLSSFQMSLSPLLVSLLYLCVCLCPCNQGGGRGMRNNGDDGMIKTIVIVVAVMSGRERW